MGRADDGAIRSGTPAELLMERAGTAVAHVAIDLAGGRYGRRAVVVCGKGNNGGDGYVAARVLLREGVAVSCVAVSDPSTLEGAARHHHDLYRAAGGRVTSFDGRIPDADVVVDAIFGTGFRGTAEGDAAKAIDATNAAAAAVLSVDIPSGVDGATGRVDGPAVRADVTLVVAGEKIGTALAPGALHAGRVQLVDIGIDVAGFGSAFVLDAPGSIPRTDPTSHKRSAGAVALLAGSDAMRGAAVLAARGAQRIGCGYVTVGSTAAVKAAVHTASPEALATAVVDGPWLEPNALDSFADAIDTASAVAAGPGIGRGDGQRDLIARLLREVETPLVLDADALNVLADDPRPLTTGRAADDVVITPHPAELARLMGIDTADVQRDRLGSARAAADRFGVIVALKGWRSVIVAPQGPASVCPTGGPELATAGTGDVLTGAIAGLGGGRRGAQDAAYVHGLAGTIAGRERGAAGVVAWDVAEALPLAWDRIAAGESADWLG